MRAGGLCRPRRAGQCSRAPVRGPQRPLWRRRRMSAASGESGASGRVAIVGTGLVGSGWAIVFARAGFSVSLYDAADGAAERARSLILDRSHDLRDAGLIDDPAPIHARIACAATPRRGPRRRHLRPGERLRTRRRQNRGHGRNRRR
ncbi:MAG: 3-hydroxyacyl-CoA dehydrogenase NAD-binding domain-containing protein, partial [Rhodopila sp.]